MLQKQFLRQQSYIKLSLLVVLLLLPNTVLAQPFPKTDRPSQNHALGLSPDRPPLADDAPPVVYEDAPESFAERYVFYHPYELALTSLNPEVDREGVQYRGALDGFYGRLNVLDESLFDSVSMQKYCSSIEWSSWTRARIANLFPELKEELGDTLEHGFVSGLSRREKYIRYIPPEVFDRDEDFFYRLGNIWARKLAVPVNEDEHRALLAGYVHGVRGENPDKVEAERSLHQYSSGYCLGLGVGYNLFNDSDGLSKAKVSAMGFSGPIVGEMLEPPANLQGEDRDLWRTIYEWGWSMSMAFAGISDQRIREELAGLLDRFKPSQRGSETAGAIPDNTIGRLLGYELESIRLFFRGITEEDDPRAKESFLQGYTDGLRGKILPIDTEEKGRLAFYTELSMVGAGMDQELELVDGRKRVVERAKKYQEEVRLREEREEREKLEQLESAEPSE